jgi:hypothetical protein
MATKKRRRPPSVGWRETVELLDLELPPMVAKIDTGARTSSLHATDLVVKRRQGIEHISFTTSDASGNPVRRTAPLVEERTIRNPGEGGREEDRPVVECRVRLGNKEWDAEFTLADRSNMQYQVLLGREAIRERFSVDVSRSFVRSKRLRGVEEDL